MTKTILTLMLALVVAGVSAQNSFEVKDFGKFKLHSYVTADPLGDMSYIIEGREALVILEPPVFHANISEFGEYTAKLGKPIERVIANYHAGSFKAYDGVDIIMVEGMPEFSQGEIYSGMMGSFAQAFGDAIDTREGAHTATVPFNATQTWAGVSFKFVPGAGSDFPAASILIGDKVYYTHFTPAVAHFSPLQITGRDAVDAQLAELKNAKASGATTFIGGHGGATADISAVDFQIAYLKKVKETINLIKTGDEYILVMKMTYPEIPGEENIAAVAENLYK